MCRRIIWTCLGIILIVPFASAQTIVPGGDVYGTWEASGSPYLVEGEITVPADCTLIIDPGVEVNFQGHYKFIVNGYLEAIGTETDSILFTAANTTEGWHGLRFENAPDSSHLSYCIVEYGKAIGSGPDNHGGAIYCENSNPVLSHSTIRWNMAEYFGGGIYLNEAGLDISNCEITNNTGYLSGGGVWADTSNISISNCEVSGNSTPTSSDTTWGGGGLCFRACEVNMTLCTVTDNHAPNWGSGGISIGRYCNATITDCEIAFNTAFQGGGMNIIDCDATLTDCDIHDNDAGFNGGGGIVVASFLRNTNITFSNCTINANQSDDEAGGIYFYNWDYQIIGSLQNCVISNNTADRAAGVFCEYNCTVELQSCTITGNVATTGGGGGLRCDDGATATAYDCLVSNNSAPKSAGVSSTSGSTINLQSCIITGNTAFSEHGGGLFCGPAILTVDDCLVSNNTAGTFGGGIYGFNGANVSISNTTISDNSAYQDGGGILGLNGSNTTVNNSVISGNYTSGSGGGIVVDGIANVNVGNTVVSDNHADLLGGGLITYGPLNMEHCVVSGNTAISGGAMYIHQAAPEIGNTIVEGNFGSGGVYFYSSPDARFQYSDFYNNEGGDFVGDVPTGLGIITGVNVNGHPCDDFVNIFEDPEFVYPTQEDFRLAWGSACIDAGLGVDPDATAADIGAFYYDQSMPLRILMTPFDMPIEIPATGGSFNYYIQVTNIAMLSLNVDAWCDVTLPNWAIYGPTLGPVNINLGSEVTIGRERTQAVPAGAPAGEYIYNAYAAAGPDTSHDSFAFVKLGTDGMDGMAGWFNTGESFEELNVSEASIPLTYSLDQNYPNPFNPVTTISYGLPEAVKVKLAVYDVSGRLVATLIDGWRDAGNHHVTFDGSALTSGVYFYRFTAGQYEASGKMVLMK